MCKGILFLFRFGFFMIFKVLTSHLSACLAIASKVSGFPVHVAKAQAKPQRSSWTKQQPPNPQWKNAWKSCKQQRSGILPISTTTKYIMWCPATVSRLSSCDLNDSVGQQQVDEFDMYSFFSQVEALTHRAPARYWTPQVPIISAWNCWNTIFSHVCKQTSTLAPTWSWLTYSPFESLWCDTFPLGT